MVDVGKPLADAQCHATIVMIVCATGIQEKCECTSVPYSCSPVNFFEEEERRENKRKKTQHSQLSGGVDLMKILFSRSFPQSGRKVGEDRKKAFSPHMTPRKALTPTMMPWDIMESPILGLHSDKEKEHSALARIRGVEEKCKSESPLR